MRSILITDSLQNDFVAPIGRFDPLPNALHIGYEESRRLLGEDPLQGPVARVIHWAHQQPDSQLKVIHVRDWHDAADARQQSHLAQFGNHCLRDSDGARFVFSVTDAAPGKRIDVVDATTLSNFTDAELGKSLTELGDQPMRIGLMGVWTEAKITFLAYDLRSRYPHSEIAVCSALTASSSRQNHFLALDQLERILGVRVLTSPGEFVEYLGGQMKEAPLIGFSEKHPVLSLVEGEPLSETDYRLTRYLFRGCREVAVRSLDGGFSGNRVLAVASVDLLGHEEAPHVLKIGARGPISQERASFERVESVLGNSAPRIADFADLGDRGAIKYRYAAMGRGASRSLQKIYESGASEREIKRILSSVFADQLRRFYRAAELESTDLLAYYQFSSQWAPSVKAKVTQILGAAGEADVLEFLGGRKVANIANFYASELDALPKVRRAHYFSHIHGDLNGANIIVDAQSNVWLIDFFHSHRGHILKDLVKLENDVLYIYTKIDSEATLAEALALTDALLRVEDLGSPLPKVPIELNDPCLRRAWQTLRQLRSYYPEFVKADRDPTQLLVAQVRYAVHTLGFDESSHWQKRWALYTACSAAAQLRRRLTQTAKIRIDWLQPAIATEGRLGVTWLPGRRDAGRDMPADIQRIKEQKVRGVVCLLADDEFARYGVDELLTQYQRAGLEVLHVPIVDGSTPTHTEMRGIIAWIDNRLSAQQDVIVHCVGGLGRAGTVAACWLKSRGSESAAAIQTVRSVRSARAIETQPQEEFIAAFGRR